VAHAGGHYDGRAYEGVLFDGSASTDPYGTITDYVWDFGDGYGSPGKIVPHFYRAAGSYAARLTVRDTRGLSASDIATVTIAEQTFTGRCAVTQGFRPFDSGANELTAFADMIILAPESFTYKPQVKVVVQDPLAHRYDTGPSPVDSPFTHTFTQPPAGSWIMSVDYYFVHRTDPTIQIHVDRRESFGSVVAPPGTGRPRIEGLNNLWWFGGLPNFIGSNPTEIAVSVFNNPGPCTWTIQRGFGLVRFKNTFACTAIVEATDHSSVFNDVSIVVDAAGGQSDPFYLTVRTPYLLTFQGSEVDTPVFDGTPLGSFSSRIGPYVVRDQFYQRVLDTQISERLGFSSSSAPGWSSTPTPSSFHSIDGNLWDTIAKYGCFSCDPSTTDPNDPNSWTFVRDIPQEQWVGPPQSVFTGVRVQGNTQRWYRGHGRHVLILSPYP